MSDMNEKKLDPDYSKDIDELKKRVDENEKRVDENDRFRIKITTAVAVTLYIVGIVLTILALVNK